MYANARRRPSERLCCLLFILSFFFKGMDGDPLGSPLDAIAEDEGAQIAPIPPSSYTLRDYVDRSETLQKLVMLGEWSPFTYITY